MADPCEVYRSQARTARKWHRCYECRGYIRPGEKYIYGSGIFDHAPFNHRICPECDALYTELTKDLDMDEMPAFGEMAEYVSEMRDDSFRVRFEAIRASRGIQKFNHRAYVHGRKRD